MQYYYCKFSLYEDVSMLSYFPSLEYCYFESSRIIPHIVHCVYNALWYATTTHINPLSKSTVLHKAFNSLQQSALQPYQSAETEKKKSTTQDIPRRSPIQVLTLLNAA